MVIWGKNVDTSDEGMRMGGEGMTKRARRVQHHRISVIRKGVTELKKREYLNRHQYNCSRLAKDSEGLGGASSRDYSRDDPRIRGATAPG